MKVQNNASAAVVRPFAQREILYAFHDIDGTHSLIREWPPVMSAVLYYVIENGLCDDFDSEENLRRVIELTGTRPLPETDDFCVESAGLSALTQMEWAIRRSIDNGKISISCDKALNREKIDKIYRGEEIFAERDSAELEAYLAAYTPRLFRFYEQVLNGYCRDKNLKQARENPEKYLVQGSMEFMRFLKEKGVKNYFVTGAVVEKGMGMHEEVMSLGFEIGEGLMVEDIIGSSWDKKLPKDVIMEKLAAEMKIDGANILVLGDGRAEIAAGVKMGALTVSRLDKNATRQRTLHQKLGTNIIIESYNDPDFCALFE